MTEFDPFAAPELMFPCYTPLRRSLPGQPETHAERMARTDRQLEQERRERAELAALDEALEDWTRTDSTYVGNVVAHEVLKLHAPVLDNHIVTCNECCGCDYCGEAVTEWPCGTFRVIKELL